MVISNLQTSDEDNFCPRQEPAFLSSALSLQYSWQSHSISVSWIFYWRTEKKWERGSLFQLRLFPSCRSLPNFPRQLCICITEFSPWMFAHTQPSAQSEKPTTLIDQRCWGWLAIPHSRYWITLTGAQCILGVTN